MAKPKKAFAELFKEKTDREIIQEECEEATKRLAELF